MSPDQLEDFIIKEPFVPLRLTLASGDVVHLDVLERIWIVGMHLYYLISDDPRARIGKKIKIISIPNITLVEPVDSPQRRNGRRRR